MKDEKNNFKFFLYLSLFWISLGWGLFLLTLLGIFYWWSVAVLLSLIFSLLARFILKSLIQTSRLFLITNLGIILIAVVFSLFSSPTVFSGRDQASISQAAIRLTQSGRLEFSNSVTEDFYKINNLQKDKLKNCLIDNLDDFKNKSSLKSKIYKTYCQAITSSKAFNFPGFYYTAGGQIVTQFPLVYIAWLGAFYLFLGLPGLIVANGALIYFFLLSFYLLVSKITTADKKAQLIIPPLSILLMATTFSLMWFNKLTLTENMATPLLWTGIVIFFSLVNPAVTHLKNKKMELLLIFLSFGLLVFTRIEGIAFFGIIIFLLLLNKNSKAYFRKNFKKIILPVLIVFSAILAWNIYADVYFYKAISKAFIKNFTENPANLNTNNELLSIVNLFIIFAFYGILTPMLMGTVGIFSLIREKDYIKLLPLFIVSPSFIYILSPQISADHPWMLRRFVFAILPIFIFYTIILLNNLFKHKKFKTFIAFSLLILISNLYSFSYYLTFSPGKKLLESTAELSKNFSTKDLILIDQMASGDNWEMIADPLNSIFNKNAVYFFDVADLNKIDKNKYEKIYLVTPENKIDYYKKSSLGDKLKFISNYSLSSDSLEKNTPIISLPKKELRQTNGSIFEIMK